MSSSAEKETSCVKISMERIKKLYPEKLEDHEDYIDKIIIAIKSLVGHITGVSITEKSITIGFDAQECTREDLLRAIRELERSSKERIEELVQQVQDDYDDRSTNVLGINEIVTPEMIQALNDGISQKQWNLYARQVAHSIQHGVEEFGAHNPIKGKDVLKDLEYIFFGIMVVIDPDVALDFMNSVMNIIGKKQYTWEDVVNFEFGQDDFFH